MKVAIDPIIGRNWFK